MIHLPKSNYSWRRKPLRTAERLLPIARQALQGSARLLPGERELAQELEVSRRVLQQALHLLEVCGVIRGEQGRGTYVEPESSWRALPEPGSKLLLARPQTPSGDSEAFMLGEFLQGIDDVISALGADLKSVPWSDALLLAVLPSELRSVRGAIVIDPPGAGLVMQLLDSSSGPIAALEHDIEDLPLVSISDGSFRGTYDATMALVELGHRHIAFLDREDWEAANRAKVQGYQTALARSGLPAGRDRVGLVPVREDFGAVARQMEEWMNRSDPPTALIAFRDAAALQALEWIRKRGLEPGRDFSIIGSGDQAYRRGLSSTLSSVRIHYRRMGEAAALEALCGVRSREMRTVIVPNRLKLRASAGPGPGASAERNSVSSRTLDGNSKE